MREADLLASPQKELNFHMGCVCLSIHTSNYPPPLFRACVFFDMAELILLLCSFCNLNESRALFASGPHLKIL